MELVNAFGRDTLIKESGNVNYSNRTELEITVVFKTPVCTLEPLLVEDFLHCGLFLRN